MVNVFKLLTKVFMMCGVLFIFCGCEDKELKEKYLHGLQLIENKEWERATNTFKELGDYEDSKDMLKKIVYLENVDKVESGLKYPSLYQTDLDEGLDALLDIKDYGDTKLKLDVYLQTIKDAINVERNVENSAQKDYSVTTFKYVDILSNFAYDEVYKTDAKKYLCEVATQAFNEGFATYTFTSTIKYHCEDKSFLENSKYYKMVDKSWSGEKDHSSYSSYSYFIQFLTSDVMTYDETYISIYGMVPIKYSYWYKIYNNAIYVKTNKNDEYEKKFTISRLDESTLKFSEYSYTLSPM